MVLPFVAAVARDVFDTVPPLLKEAGYGMGYTTWEVLRHIVIPYTRVGVLGGVMLGLGRALGETMAVTFVIGNADVIPSSLFAPGTTIPPRSPMSSPRRSTTFTPHRSSNSASSFSSSPSSCWRSRG